MAAVGVTRLRERYSACPAFLGALHQGHTGDRTCYQGSVRLRVPALPKTLSLR